MRMGLGWSPARSNWGPEYRCLGLFVLKNDGLAYQHVFNLKISSVNQHVWTNHSSIFLDKPLPVAQASGDSGDQGFWAGPKLLVQPSLRKEPQTLLYHIIILLYQYIYILYQYESCDIIFNYLSVMLGRGNCIGSISEDICKVDSGSTQVITWFYVRNQTSSNSQRSPTSKKHYIKYKHCDRV